MLIKTYHKDIDIDLKEKKLNLNSILNKLKKKLNINNIECMTLICDNNIITDKNLNLYIDKKVFLYINRHKNKDNAIINLIRNLFEFENINIEINSENYEENLNKLIEMGYDSSLASEALENNNNNLIESINYLTEDW